MKILLANPRGFCAGVNMAIECLEQAIRYFGTPIYVYHEIVHNRHVVERFRGQGVTFVDDIDEVPEGSILLYSAHGVSPEVREKARRRKLKTIDATCPLVTKVHLEAVRFAREGYHILLIGHEGHDEVIGTMGEVPDRITLVESAEDVDRLPFDSSSRLAYLTQTTLSVQEAEQIIRRLRERFPQIVGPPKEDICYATTNRQEAVSQLAPQADAVIVLGSQNSSNSRRLMEIAQAMGKPAFLVDSVDELRDPQTGVFPFQPDDTILVTAGASAPDDVVQDCVRKLLECYGGATEEVTVREEQVHFQLPHELRVIASSR